MPFMRIMLFALLFIKPVCGATNKTIRLLHIPKTAGFTLLRAWNKLFPDAKIEQHEACYETYVNPNYFNTVFLRNPLDHVFSQFLECKYDDWGRDVTKNTYFPRNGTDIEDFEIWLNHFGPEWRMKAFSSDLAAEGDYNCYTPWNLQTRALTCITPYRKENDDSHHINKKDMHRYTARNAMAHLNVFDFVGITEFSEISICVLQYKYSGILDNICRSRCGPVPVLEERVDRVRHGVPSPLTPNRSEIVDKMQGLTEGDAIVYRYALRLFRLDVLNIEQITGVEILCDDDKKRMVNLLVSVWDHYQLGDQFLMGRGHDVPYFPSGSINEEYSSKTIQPQDWGILRTIIEGRVREIPGKNVCIVHLRTGDVIENSNATAEEFWFKGVIYHKPESSWKHQYTYPKSYYVEMSKILANYPQVDTVEILYGNHVGPKVRRYTDYKTMTYIDYVKKFFASCGYMVRVLPPTTPDEDFVYMTQAAYFIHASGGFSNMISHMVKTFGGKVL